MAIAEDYIDAEIRASKEAMNGNLASQAEAQQQTKTLREMLTKAIENAKDGLVFDN